MYELKKNGKVLTSKSVWTGPLSYEKRIYRTAVSQSLRNTVVHDVQYTFLIISRSLLLIMRNVLDKLCIGHQNALFTFNNCVPKMAPFMK